MYLYCSSFDAGDNVAGVVGGGHREALLQAEHCLLRCVAGPPRATRVERPAPLPPSHTLQGVKLGIQEGNGHKDTEQDQDDDDRRLRGEFRIGLGLLHLDELCLNILSGHRLLRGIPHYSD